MLKELPMELDLWPGIPLSLLLLKNTQLTVKLNSPELVVLEKISQWDQVLLRKPICLNSSLLSGLLKFLTGTVPLMLVHLVSVLITDK